MEGYKPMFNETLVTVWSAPNYCYRCGNVAAIMEVDDKLKKTYKIFEAAPQDVRGFVFSPFLVFDVAFSHHFDFKCTCQTDNCDILSLMQNTIVGFCLFFTRRRLSSW